ncbi:hypothetical protein GCM10010187_76190 [Actinomadura coerulea]|nr:hypothetical protein GCM10010187_76190 [Actinomadura coerulea]
MHVHEGIGVRPQGRRPQHDEEDGAADRGEAEADPEEQRGAEAAEPEHEQGVDPDLPRHRVEDLLERALGVAEKALGRRDAGQPALLRGLAETEELVDEGPEKGPAQKEPSCREGVTGRVFGRHGRRGPQGGLYGHGESLGRGDY